MKSFSRQINLQLTATTKAKKPEIESQNAKTLSTRAAINMLFWPDMYEKEDSGLTAEAS